MAQTVEVELTRDFDRKNPDVHMDKGIKELRVYFKMREDADLYLSQHPDAAFALEHLRHSISEAPTIHWDWKVSSNSSG